MSIPQGFFGTLPGWITAVSTVSGFLWALMRFGLGWRKQTLDSDEQIRGYFERELTSLRSKLNAQEDHFKNLEKHWRDMLEASDQRHNECEEARQRLRVELDRMHDELRGLKRQITHYSADRLTILEDRGCPSDVAPHSVAAAKRIKDSNDGK